MKPPKKSRKTVQMAKRLRREMTPPEVFLWQHLRGQELVKIRRDHPIGPYALDFYCSKAKLAIEVDGIAHDMGDNPARDVRRDDYVAELGIETIRIPAKVVLKNSVEIADSVVRMCLARMKEFKEN
jgi:very-short-patch-repair endonuclease